MQEFDTTIEQLAHGAYRAVHEDCIRREAGKALVDTVEDPTIKLQLLLGGEKLVKEALRQALELQAITPSSQAPKNKHQDILGKTIAPNRAKRPNTHRRRIA